MLYNVNVSMNPFATSASFEHELLQSMTMYTIVLNGIDNGITASKYWNTLLHQTTG